MTRDMAPTLYYLFSLICGLGKDKAQGIFLLGWSKRQFLEHVLFALDIFPLLVGDNVRKVEMGHLI